MKNIKFLASTVLLCTALFVVNSASAKLKVDSMHVKILTDDGNNETYTQTNGTLYCQDGFVSSGQVDGLPFGVSQFASKDEVSAVEGKFVIGLNFYLIYKKLDLSCFPRSSKVYMLHGEQVVLITNTPKGYKPTVSVIANQESINEEANTAGSFTISLNGPTAKDTTVFYKITGNAKQGKDYKKLSGKMVIRKGSTSIVVYIAPKNDFIAEEDEKITLSIKPNNKYAISNESSAQTIIIDND